jgi:hypothetical protein
MIREFLLVTGAIAVVLFAYLAWQSAKEDPMALQTLTPAATTRQQ